MSLFPLVGDRARVVVRLPKGFASTLLFIAYLEGGGPFGTDQVAERLLRRGLEE